MKEIVSEEHIECCLECGEPLFGRKGKRFCNKYCRCHWHNRNKERVRLTRIHTIDCLSRNYEILDKMLRLGKTGCDLKTLTEMGFCQEFVTHKGEKIGAHIEYRCFDAAFSLSSVKLFNLHRV